MNTYKKYCPNVYVAECTELHEKGEVIELQTKYGKVNRCIVYNHLLSRNGKHYYSIVREDGFNFQEHAKRRAEKLHSFSATAEKKSEAYYIASNEGREFLMLGEPIKIGHHSERRHRALIERNWDRMGKSVEYGKRAEKYIERVEYWEERANLINLSMPESIDFYAYKLEKAIELQAGLKNGTIAREHSFSLTYATKAVKEAKKNYETAQKLWA